MLYLINHIIWFDDNSIRRAIRREIYFCLIEEKSLYIIRASTNTNLKKLLGNNTKREIKAIFFDRKNIINFKEKVFVWDDSLLKTNSIEGVLIDFIYYNFFFINYFHITRSLWGVRRLD